MSQLDKSVSVIIPNYNRADALPATCSALLEQQADLMRIELIVVDDGSTDESLAIMNQFQRSAPFPVTVLRQIRRGPGSARNYGASVARNELLLFLDSDIIVEPTLIFVHAELQASRKCVLVAGSRRAWPPACVSTFSKVMYLAKSTEDQFCDQSPTFQDVFSCNMSIRRDDFDRIGGFDEGLWAFEDVDLAYRAQQAGMHLLFAQGALGYHNHPMTLQQAYQQQRHYQRYASRFVCKHPELVSQVDYLFDKWPIDLRRDSMPLVLRKLTRQFISLIPLLKLQEYIAVVLERVFPNRHLLRFLYWKIIAGYQLHGLREGLKALRE